MLKLCKYDYAGKLIVFEGTDGSGKTTLIGMTYDYLVSKYGADRVIMQKQPTDAVRNSRLFQKMMYGKEHEDVSYRAVQLLTLSDRIQHNTEVILPALKEGKFVLCDRYIYTSVVNMLARGYTHEAWFFRACREIVKPDFAFLAYVDPETAIERIEKRPEEKGRYLDKELLKQVSKNFLQYGKRFGLCTVLTNRSAEEAFYEIKKALDRITVEEIYADDRFKVFDQRPMRKTL